MDERTGIFSRSVEVEIPSCKLSIDVEASVSPVPAYVFAAVYIVNWMLNNA
jgi:hypothetical protein